MTENFVASNEVILDQHGYNLTMDYTRRGQYHEARKEFYQHLRDKELGRWRSKIDSNWTAVLDDSDGMIIFRHDGGVKMFFVPSGTLNCDRWSESLKEIANEYIQNHSPKKPWHAAKPGEVWVLTIDGIEHPWGVDSIIPERFVYAGGDSADIPFDYPDITDGHRIWPEGSND